MRVSDSMITDNLVYRLQIASERLFASQEQAASGLRFTRPSQDPAGTVQAAALRSSITQIDRYLENADVADSRLRLTEVAVSQISDALREARNLALAGMNDGLDDTSRVALAEQIAQIADQIISAGNCHDGHRYLLAGTQVFTAPLVRNPTPPPPVLYQGDQADLPLQVGPGISVVANLHAAEVLNMNGAADPALEDVFTTLADLETAVRGNDHDSMQACLQSLDSHFARVTSLRGEIGARMQRIAFDRRRLDEVKLSARTLLGEIEGADLAEVVTQLHQQQIAYEAAAAAAALLGRAGLLQYLR
jgi:flagellar hook-associated protein 3 FlgL